MPRSKRSKVGQYVGVFLPRLVLKIVSSILDQGRQKNQRTKRCHDARGSLMSSVKVRRLQYSIRCKHTQKNGNTAGCLKWEQCGMLISKQCGIFGKSEHVLAYFSRYCSQKPLSTARIFFGRGAVMAKALGTTPAEEHRPGLHKLAKVRQLISIALTSL